MTSKDLQAELYKEPFLPLRLQLVSGTTVEIPRPGIAWLMQNSVLVFQNVKPGRTEATGYDVIAFRNIERIEQRAGKGKKAG